MSKLLTLLSILCLTVAAHADMQDGADIGSIITQAIQSAKFQAEIAKQGLEDQTADVVELKLIQPRPTLYGLRVSYNTGSKVCEVNMPVSTLKITGQAPAVQLFKADSSCMVYRTR